MKKTKLITIGTSVLLLANAGLAPATVLAEELTSPNIEEVQTEESTEAEVAESQEVTEPSEVTEETEVTTEVEEDSVVNATEQEQADRGQTRGPALIAWGKTSLNLSTKGPLLISNEETTGVLTIELKVNSLASIDIADKSFYRVSLPKEFKPLLEDERFIDYITGNFRQWFNAIKHVDKDYTKQDIRVDAENCELIIRNPKVTGGGILPVSLMYIDIDLGRFVSDTGVRIPDALDGKYHFNTAMSQDENIIDWTILGNKEAYAFLDIKKLDPAYGTAVPVITASDRKVVRGEDFSGAYAMQGVSAYDEEDGDITHKVTIVDGQVNTAVNGTYPITYGVTDSHGLRARKTINVVVSDNTPPVINAKDVTIAKGSSFNPMNNVTATDAEDGDITNKIVVVSNNVNTSVAGKYYVTYRVTDKHEATVEKTITVTVTETTGTITPNTYKVGNQNITGTYTGAVKKAVLYINGNATTKGGSFINGSFTYYVGNTIKASDKVKLVAYSADDRKLDEKEVKVTSDIVSGTMTPNNYYVGNDYIKGTFTGPIKSAKVIVNGVVLSKGGSFSNGSFSYWVGPNRIKATDSVYINGYDANGNVISQNNRVNVLGSTTPSESGTISPTSYLVGDGEISGTYTGSVKKARLSVNGKVVSWGGNFKDGKFTYYVGAGTIKAGDTVTLNAYGTNNKLLQENVNVKVVTSTEEGRFTSAEYTVGDAEIEGTYSGVVKKARLTVNGKVVSWGGSFKNNKFTYYVGKNVIKKGDTVVLDAYDENDGLLHANYGVSVKEDLPAPYQGAIQPNDYTLGTLEITGAYIGDVKQARLYVNNNLISIGGSFKADGSFTYFVGNSIKKGDIVQLKAYGPDGKELDAKFVTVK